MPPPFLYYERERERKKRVPERQRQRQRQRRRQRQRIEEKRREEKRESKNQTTHSFPDSSRVAPPRAVPERPKASLDAPQGSLGPPHEVHQEYHSKKCFPFSLCQVWGGKVEPSWHQNPLRINIRCEQFSLNKNCFSFGKNKYFERSGGRNGE